MLNTVAGCATPVPTADFRPLSAVPAGDSRVALSIDRFPFVIGLVPTGNDKEPLPAVSLDLATILCGVHGCHAPDDAKPLRLTMVVVPIEFGGEMLTIDPHRRGPVTTALAPTYYPNLLWLQVLAIEAKDHRSR